MKSAGRIAIAITAFGVLLAAVWGVALRPPSHFHPYVVFQASDSLQITFLQNAYLTSDECQKKTDRLAKVMLGQCAICRVLESRCLEKLDPQQEKMLKNEPVDFPTMRTSGGVVAFLSDKADLADEICRESVRQSSKRNGAAQCLAAGVAGTAASAAIMGKNPQPTEFTFNGTLVLILFVATLSLVVSYLVVRSGRLSGSLWRNVAENTSSGTASKDLQAGKLAKLCIDLFLAIVLLALLSPLLVLVALLIFALEGRPIFYISRRYISASHSALIFKFRAMVRDATNPKHRLNERFMRNGFLDIPLSCEIYTPIGRFLERTQLVETPQLLNIIFDGLSFVGNRPLPATNVEHLRTSFPGWTERFDSPAGITGIAQVVGRRNLTPSERIELETQYSRVYQHGNIVKCDMKIIWLTAFVVFFDRGIEISDARALLKSCLPESMRRDIG